MSREVAKLPSGVALFVAAVAYDDGRVWTQDTARESLFYFITPFKPRLEGSPANAALAPRRIENRREGNTPGTAFYE